MCSGSHICDVWNFVSLNSRLESAKQKQVEGGDVVVAAGESQTHVREQVQHLVIRVGGLVRVEG